LKLRKLREQELQESIMKLESDCAHEAAQATKSMHDLMEMKRLSIRPVSQQSKLSKENKKLQKEISELKSSTTDLLRMLDKKTEQEREFYLEKMEMSLEVERLEEVVVDLRKQLATFKTKEMSEPERSENRASMRNHRRYVSLMTDMQTPRLLEVMAQRQERMETLQSDVDLPLVFSPPIVAERSSIMKVGLNTLSSRNLLKLTAEVDENGSDESSISESWTSTNPAKSTVDGKIRIEIVKENNKLNEELPDMRGRQVV